MTATLVGVAVQVVSDFASDDSDGVVTTTAAPAPPNTSTQFRLYQNLKVDGGKGRYDTATGMLCQLLESGFNIIIPYDFEI